ncbi:unnamed protein product [Leuciscus chuanchicus]
MQPFSRMHDATVIYYSNKTTAHAKHTARLKPAHAGPEAKNSVCVLKDLLVTSSYRIVQMPNFSIVCITGESVAQPSLCRSTFLRSSPLFKSRSRNMDQRLGWLALRLDLASIRVKLLG